MTNDLAIRILSGAILGTTEQTHEAVAMAIKALSALPSASDLIDRRAAIGSAMKDVVAWMPLPEPYKGGEQNG